MTQTDIAAPVYTDAAGVHWTCDRLSPQSRWVLCVSNPHENQIGFSMVVMREELDMLPAASDRADIVGKLQAFARENPPVRTTQGDLSQ